MTCVKIILFFFLLNHKLRFDEGTSGFDFSFHAVGAKEVRSRAIPESKLPCTLHVEDDYTSASYDGIVFVVTPEVLISSHLESLLEPLKSKIKIDKQAESEITVLPSDLPAGRIIYSPTGPVTIDYVDARAFSDATRRGIDRALKAGVESPLLILPSHPSYKNAELVSILGAFEELYVNLQLREDVPEKAQKVEVLGVYSEDHSILPNIVRLAKALESGRFVARDIGGSDPERMAPPKVVEYIEEAFKDTVIDVQVISDPEVINEEYPLFCAVDRATRGIPRHAGRIVYLTYEPSSGPITRTLYLVGKGVTYDSGGADVKVGGAMVGMSRDKSGGAAAVGFMKVVAALKPNGIKVVAGVPLVRNSIGANGYVADEVIVSRNKRRVRVVNTDAEGRMIMGDVLAKLREDAETAVDPHLITIATLTGHARNTVGAYSIVLDNGPAKSISHAEKLQQAGEELGDMLEISRIRREDIAFLRGQGMGDDVIQANNRPSVASSRGHQNPTGFMLMVSGLDKHGSESSLPLKYSHIDIAGSAGYLPDESTAVPIISLAAHHLHECFS